MEQIKLTQFSHGAGCGCKIAPGVLEEILATAKGDPPHEKLLVGTNTNDDAAAFDLGNETSVLSTTDFFMPIVDDPFLFGKIAATNAISDIYAMGGTPIMALSILGWPIEKLSSQVAQRVIEGGRVVCAQAGIPLAGGHSIDAPEPLFGLAVTGVVENTHLKTNAGATKECLLYLTKPLGIGILTTAQKRGVVGDDLGPALEVMCTLNTVGATLARFPGLRAMTDVTGFGLLGHLLEMCEGSGVGAVVEYAALQFLPKVKTYLDLQCVPGGTHKNFLSYGHKVGDLTQEQKALLCDPQTSGGLLLAVERDTQADFEALAQETNLPLSPIGYTRAHTTPLIEVT